MESCKGLIMVIELKVLLSGQKNKFLQEIYSSKNKILLSKYKLKQPCMFSYWEYQKVLNPHFVDVFKPLIEKTVGCTDSSTGSLFAHFAVLHNYKVFQWSLSFSFHFPSEKLFTVLIAICSNVDLMEVNWLQRKELRRYFWGSTIKLFLAHRKSYRFLSI